MRLDVVRSALEQSGGVSDSFSDAVTLGSGREVHLLDPRTKPDASSVRLGVSFALGTLVCLGILWAAYVRTLTCRSFSSHAQPQCLAPDWGETQVHRVCQAIRWACIKHLTHPKGG